LSSVGVFVWAIKNFVFIVKRCERIVGARKSSEKQLNYIESA